MTAMPGRGFEPADLAYVAVFAALLAVFSKVAFTLFGSPVPFTLQTLAVSLCGLCLGPWRGLAAVALWVLVGIAGIPVFADVRVGPSVLLGSTGGYIVSFMVSVVIVGLITRRVIRHGLGVITAVVLFGVLTLNRLLVILPLGVGWFSYTTKSPFLHNVLAIDFPFWPWDTVKNVIAVVIAVAVHKAFPRLLAQ